MNQVEDFEWNTKSRYHANASILNWEDNRKVEWIGRLTKEVLIALDLIVCIELLKT